MKSLMNSMKPSTDLSTARNRVCFLIGVIALITLFSLSLFVGRFPLSLGKLLSGDEFELKVFWTLRFSRVLVGLFGGIALGMAGFVFQVIFKNPLAAPDIIGVASGASAGAAFGILFFPVAFFVTFCSFFGAIISVLLAIIFSSIDRSDRKGTVILAGIAVHSLAQTFLMILKTIADPQRQLASIEYWIMGSLNGVNIHRIPMNLSLLILCIFILILLHRQSLLLSQDEDEAKMLGVNVPKMRTIILIVATLLVSSVVSLTGLISFVGLLAPHAARRIMGDNSLKTFVFSGITGGVILLLADIFARSFGTELPVSIFTSLIGAPFLVFLILKGRDRI